MATQKPSKMRITPRPKRVSDVASVDIDRLWEVIDKMASAVNATATFTEQIPDIKKKVDDTATKVIELDLKMGLTTERMGRVEAKVEAGHPCPQAKIVGNLQDLQRETSAKIEKDVQKGIAQAGKIAAVVKDQAQIEADVTDIRKAPRRMFYGLIGVIVVLISGGFSAAWFLAKLEANVVHERTQRSAQYKRIESQIKTVGRNSNVGPMKQALVDLEHEIEISNGHERAYNRLCLGMSRGEKVFMRGALSKQGRRLPPSCLE